ncbi:kinase-like protein, partial [Fistulina hepatica ATCC 64428]
TSSAPSARPRRRSSQQRVSLIAGRLSIAPMEPPDVLSSETSSLVGSVVSTRAPSPDAQPHTGGRSIADFVIEKQIGRGAYGLVKRAREKMPDGSLGPPVIIKLVIKQRILADCWKKHPKYGTIPIEIYVLSSVMNTSYILPARRPWDSLRFLDPEARDDDWEEGKVIKGHPNICPFLEFFEDNTYYYLVMPCTTPELPPAPPDQPAPVAIVNGAPAPPVEPPSDLFDLVEHYPQGLLSRDIRTYLGQIADALHFLHEHGIVHRDIKDENVILGPKGRCILIDFGSSGLTKKGEWDTFSGTLDYAGPEILRGQRYTGKPQDVWAFGVVAYVLVVGECPFENAEEAQEGLSSPFSRAMIALDDRCSGEAGEEVDGGGALVDAMALIKACLQVDVDKRPTFERILQCKFLSGAGGW